MVAPTPLLNVTVIVIAALIGLAAVSGAFIIHSFH